MKKRQFIHLNKHEPVIRTILSKLIKTRIDYNKCEQFVQGHNLKYGKLKMISSESITIIDVSIRDYDLILHSCLTSNHITTTKIGKNDADGFTLVFNDVLKKITLIITTNFIRTIHNVTTFRKL